MKILTDTKFMIVIAEMAADLIKETVDSEDPHPGYFNRPFTVQEEYLRTCLITALEINTACDQLHYALTYFSGYRSRKTTNGELITRGDYIAYQIENLYLRFVMIIDRSLRLTNEVFRLGLPPRECGTRTVTNNQHLQKTDVKKHLRAIEKIIQPYREMRNTIAHLARYNDSKLKKVEAYYILQKSEGPIEDSLLERTCYLYKHKTDLYIDSKRKELGPVINALIFEVASFYETLLPYFRSNYRLLK